MWAGWDTVCCAGDVSALEAGEGPLDGMRTCAYARLAAPSWEVRPYLQCRLKGEQEVPPAPS